MKKIVILLTVLFTGTMGAQVQKTQNLYITNGGSTTPNASAILDISSTTKGFLPPRMTSSQMNAIATPATGLMVFCTDCSAKTIYSYDGSSWNPALRSNSEGLSANCSLNGFNPSYTYTKSSGTTSDSYVTLTVYNNSISSNNTFTFAASDITLSGIPGLTVGTPTPSSATIAIGGSQLVSYPISGTPTATGTLTASFKKGYADCSATTSVGSLLPLLTSPQFSFTNTLVAQQPFSGTFKIILQPKGIEIKNLAAVTTNNLTITGLSKGTLTVVSVTPSTVFTINYPTTEIVFTISGTPTSQFGSITFNFSYDDINLSSTYSVN